MVVLLMCRKYICAVASPVKWNMYKCVLTLLWKSELDCVVGGNVLAIMSHQFNPVRLQGSFQCVVE